MEGPGASHQTGAAVAGSPQRASQTAAPLPHHRRAGAGAGAARLNEDRFSTYEIINDMNFLKSLIEKNYSRKKIKKQKVIYLLNRTI